MVLWVRNIEKYFAVFIDFQFLDLRNLIAYDANMVNAEEIPRGILFGYFFNCLLHMFFFFSWVFQIPFCVCQPYFHLSKLNANYDDTFAFI